ncbi:MAG: efflux RND transporter periplasmic adaptor subunit [Betaproteobacteria bacterium]|nr:efflux RND transporter periplasmic adaptor subunit [Betaproteobacteria bacterium]
MKSRFPRTRCPARSGIAVALKAATLASALAAALAAAPGAHAGPTVSARVDTQVPQRGRLTRELRAVGSVRSAVGQNLQISFPRPVVVQRVLVHAGQRVRRGQALIQVGATAADRLAFAQTTSALRFARAELARVRDLARRQLATRSQLDAAHRAEADARAALAAAQAQGLGNAAHIVRAGFDGVVESVAASPGAHLATGAVALSLAPSAGLQAVIGVDALDAGQLRPGTSVPLHSVFDPGQRTLATIVAVAGRVDPSTGHVELTLALPAGARWAIPGLAVQAELPLRSWHGWVVPRQAVLQDASGQAYVFQDDRGHARRVNVSIEGDQGEHTAISGPLAPALPLVVLGNYELLDGMALRTQAGNSAPEAR